MEEKIHRLRREIAHYRRMLAEGMDAELARMFLDRIGQLTALLAELERRSDKTD
jgi:hypothetical protein